MSTATLEKPVLVYSTPPGESSSFWREEPPELDDKGFVIKGGMWPHQLEWWRLPTFIKVLVAGYGAGKTMIYCKRLISLALANAPAPVASVSPTYPLARKTVVVTLHSLLSGKRSINPDLRYKYNKNDHEFTIWYRGRVATIYILSGDDPESLRGPNLAAAGIDEPFLQDEAVFQQMIARIRHPDAVVKELLLTGTPEQLNWGYDLCMGELADKYREYDMEVGMVNASTRDNKALDPNYHKRLAASMTEQMAKAYIDGKFVNLASGLVYYAFDPTPKNGIHIKELPIPDNAELGVGMDFNVNPFAFAAFWRAGAHVHYFKEYELPNADTRYAAQTLREEFRDMPDPGRGIKGRWTRQQLDNIYPDATGNARKTSAPDGRTDFTYLREEGFTVKAHHDNPKRKDRYNAVNARLRPMLGPPLLTIDPKCKKLIKYLAQHSHELLTKQEAMTHLLDAIGYPIEFLFPVSGTTRIVRLGGF